jgi:putative hydrolase of the HAD superfamily
MMMKNLIFDFGGVICNIEITRTEKEFYRLGLRSFEKDYSVSNRESLFGSFEAGSLSESQFRDLIRKWIPNPVTDHQIDAAWNALLLDIPKPRIDLLVRLRSRYRLFLLSNTNPIHHRQFKQNLQEQHGFEDFPALFEKTYFSYILRMKKPSREMFEFVIRDAGIIPRESLFIDDSLEHIVGAREAGLYAYHLKKGEDIIELFNPYLDFIPNYSPTDV